ncbi:utrophin-like isoform X2 [Rhopilema esculentum]|uniref:utrophin-like isoform X2 n=1 Tax=Rhopilema esculentum TaxID=499914 RepID=UPI0031D8B020
MSRGPEIQICSSVERWKRDSNCISLMAATDDQEKRQETQKKAFTRWVNSKYSQENDTTVIKDLFVDFRDGNNLLKLLEILTGRKTQRVHGKLRLHKLNNINVALEFLKEYEVKLVNIGNIDIVDGIPVPTLGLIWSIIYRFQIQGALADIIQSKKGSSVNEKDAEKAILQWCAAAVEGYEGVDIKNFSTSWKDGLAFNALVHRFKPNLFIYKSLLSNGPVDNLEHAFSLAENSFGVDRLLEPSDFQREMIDSRLVVLYISTLYEKLKELEPKKDETVTLEEIQELKSYIGLEMEFLSGCEEFFANATLLSDIKDTELLDQYQKLMGFVEELQPHQLKVGELVNQIESLISRDFIAEEEIEPLQEELNSLKVLWQKIFDQTSTRQEGLREMLLDYIEDPIKKVDDELVKNKERLRAYSTYPSQLEPAFDQYMNFQDYVDELRLLESRIESIRTGEMAGDSLDLLSEEDAEVVTTNIQGMIEAFVDLGENVAAVKNRITDNLYELLALPVEEIKRALQRGEDLLAADANNNAMESGLQEKAREYQDHLSVISTMKPDAQIVSDISEKLDDSFFSEKDDFRQRVSYLVEDCDNQIDSLNQQIQSIDGQIRSRGTLDNWKSEVAAVMVWIKEAEHDLDKIDDLESSLVMLEEAASKMESLHAEISNYQDKINSVVKAGSKIVKEEEVSSDAAPSIRSDIRSLESTWELLREKCTAVQLSIREKVMLRQVQEKEFMAEWNETENKIESWLTSAESEAEPFDHACDDITSLESQVSEHQELVYRLATEEKTVNDLLDVGENLAGQKLRLSENKLRVKGDLKSLKKRKTKLNAKLVGQQESLTSFLDHLTRIETEIFDQWVHHCKEVESIILDLGKTESEESIDTVDGAKDYMKAEEDLLGEIRDVKPKVDGVLTEGDDLLSNGQLGKLRTQGIKTAMKSLKDLYGKKEHSAHERLREIEEELKNMQQQQHEQVTTWLSKCETFDLWIDSELKDLDSYLQFGDEEPPLEKVLSEEQGIRDIKANSDSRTSILEALIKEGATLKENKNVEKDLPEEFSRVLELMVSIQYKWQVLNKNVVEKTKLVLGILSEMQGQLLSVCIDQIDNIENVINGLNPISDGFDTLAKDAEELSELFMMIGQTRANIARFDKYANDLQTSEELPNTAKFEVRETNEMLHSRIVSVSTKADKRKLTLHEKVIDVLTESLVALHDTTSSLEQKCDDLAIPDNLETVDLVERHATLEDILNRLIACDVSLKDIEHLGQVADNCMVLETGEPEDITKEIETRKLFIDHVQRLAREKRSRIYGLMVYTFKRRVGELDKLLGNIEEGLTDNSSTTIMIPNALEYMRENEASLQELDDIQKEGEEVTLQVTELIESSAVSEQDKIELQERSRNFVDHLSEVLTSLKIENNNLKQAFSSAVKEKLLELREWLDMMQKRRESDDQVGPDSMAIKKQMTEMSVVEDQLKGKRLAQDIHHDDSLATMCLDTDTLAKLAEADLDWQHLSEWVVHRKKVLHAAQEAWEHFRQVEVDLLDYLRDKERQIKNWEPINLEDEEAVAERLAVLKEMLSGMENRKDDVQNMHKAADDVIDFIGEETAMTNSIKSQVADIHDCWNNTVRQVIEAISKLNFAKEKLQNLEDGINEVRLWLDDARSILKFYTPDIPDDVIEDLKPKVEKKCTEETFKHNTLKRINSLSKELLDDIDGPSHDNIQTDLMKLNKDWNEVTTDLGRKKDMKKRPCCWWCYRRWFLKYGYYN